MDKRDCQWASSLENYLELDTWNINDGLLILAGISPVGADINWDGYKNYLNVIIDTPTIINAHIFGEETEFYNIPFDVYEGHDWTKEDLETIKAKMEILNEAENRLKRIKRLWDNSQNTDERYPIEYFISWAQEKNITIPWFDLALDKEMIAQPITTQKEIRKEKRERLIQRKSDLKAQGVKAFIKTIAAEEHLSKSRIKQLIKGS